MKSCAFARQFAKSLAAILVGNLLYLLLMPWLPAVMQHRLYTVDSGLVVDFFLCVLVWGPFTRSPPAECIVNRTGTRNVIESGTVADAA